MSQPMKHEIGKRTYFVADVEPLDVDGIRTVTVGTLLWVVVLVALVPFKDQLTAAGVEWIYWCCFAGIGLGLWGYDHCRKRKRKRMSEEAEPAGRRRATPEATGAQTP